MTADATPPSDPDGFPMSPPPLLDDDDTYRAHRAAQDELTDDDAA